MNIPSLFFQVRNKLHCPSHQPLWTPPTPSTPAVTRTETTDSTNPTTLATSVTIFPDNVSSQTGSSVENTNATTEEKDMNFTTVDYVNGSVGIDWDFTAFMTSFMLCAMNGRS